MKDYGKLSNRSLDDMIAGARVEVAPYKRDAADFVLWKPSTPDQPGWDSPWGRGRPGWHLECSAMSEKHLGLPIDIHGGGQDLIFPHHENEIAQSVCAHAGAEFVRHWVHNGHVMVEGEKMSKSLGNFYTVRQLLDEGVRGEVIRFTLLKTHYRAPLNFSRDALKESRAILDGLYNAMHNVKQDVESRRSHLLEEALSDDLNTPLAIGELHAIPASELKAAGAKLGLLQQDPEDWRKGTDEEVVDEFLIKNLIAQRESARKGRNFKEADRIRDDLKSQGVILEDHPDRPTDWRRE
jgi:cysteinyl-tRNA synthetase